MRSSVRKEAHWQVCRSRVSRLQHIPDSTLSLFGYFSSVACGSLPSSARNCRCGLPLDSSGHHHAACAVAGVLQRSTTLNVRVQDMDLARPSAFDNRRLEIVADGLSLFHGAQLAVDTTVVSVLRRDGTPHPRCVTTDGAALETARRRKETTYPQLSGQSSWSWRQRSQGGGPKSAAVSSASWPKRKCGARLHTSDPVPDRRGTRGGAQCWHAMRLVQWLCLCSKDGEVNRLARFCF